VTNLATTAPAFVEMAHRIVWCSAATVAADGRPRTRILHPYWEWDGSSLTGWIATGPTRVKVADLKAHPVMSCSYWASNHDTCVADCRVEWHFDDETRQRTWDRFVTAPAPVGYDPAIVPPWKDGPLSPAFAALRLEPYRLRVFPGTMLLGGIGEVHHWRE
jgi:general stress protein 26